MDNWCDDYDFVIETGNLGMGIAPWNINQYKRTNVHPRKPYMSCLRNKWNFMNYTG